jgi:hypothetical protein
MSPRAYRPSSRDANESEIVKAFQKRGARVWRMEPPAPFDLLVEYRGVLRAVEVKTEKGRFTALQRLFAQSFTLYVARTDDDVADLMDAWSKQHTQGVPSAIVSKGCR